MNTWQLLERYPPILIRLLARRPHGPPLLLEEIAVRSGLSPVHIVAISMQCTWTGVDPYQIKAFMIGCNADIIGDQTSFERIRKYLSKRPTWKYLRTSTYWRSTYEPMLRAFLKHLASAKAGKQ